LCVLCYKSAKSSLMQVPYLPSRIYSNQLVPIGQGVEL